jgi:membrane protease YdiL (CAAX protease family)
MIPMSVRIAVVGDPQGPRSMLAPDVEPWVVAPSSPWLRDLSGADGVWLTVPPTGEHREALLSVARWAREHTVPLLTTDDAVPVGAAPPQPTVAAFVEAARYRAGYRQWWAAEQARLAAVAVAEAEPRPYVHQMRGPRHRWWRPLLALLVTVAGYLLLAGVLTGVFWAAGLLSGTEADFATDPGAVLWSNLLLAALIPATLLGLWVGHRRSPWRVLSVARRIRWRWMLWCTAVVTPLWAAYLALSWVVFDQEVLPRPEQWVALTAVSVLTTPLQAAGEEVAFRGGLVQSVGSWFHSPVVALVVTTTLSAGLFAAAHGSADPWVVLELASLAVYGCYLAWRTGGLEAVIVIHVVNNLLITVSGALLGGLEESYVDQTTTGSPVSAGLSVLVTGLATALLLRGARRRGIAASGWLTPARG